MQFHQAESQPYTYIVEDDNGKQLGTVDEFHTHDNTLEGFAGRVLYTGIRFNTRGMFEQKTFQGFTAALRFVGKDR